MAKKHKVDLNAAPSDAMMFLQPPSEAMVQQEQREPEPDIDLVSIFEWMEAAVETGLRIEFRWGTAASLDPAARHKRIAMSAAMPNSPFFQKDTKWQKMTKEHDTVIGAIVELMGMLPPMETKE